MGRDPALVGLRGFDAGITDFELLNLRKSLEKSFVTLRGAVSVFGNALKPDWNVSKTSF